MVISTCTPAALALVLLISTFFSTIASPANAEQRVYRIGLTFPFPPWGVGPLEGVDFDLLSAICAANEPMHCKLEPRVSSDCVDTDREGKMVIGPAMASGAINGCVAWYGTAERMQLGAEFTNGYSLGPKPQLIATVGDSRYDALDEMGSLDNAKVGFIAGFFNDDECLAAHYTDFSASFYSSEDTGRNQMVADLSGDTLDLVFWDSDETLPAGTRLVGAPVTDCGPLLSMMVFPPSKRRPHHADELRRDFNCGLALIRRNGDMEDICAASGHPGGNPNCVLEGPPPTQQCLADNPEKRRRHRKFRH